MKRTTNDYEPFQTRPFQASPAIFDTIICRAEDEQVVALSIWEMKEENLMLAFPVMAISRTNGLIFTTKWQRSWRTVLLSATFFRLLCIFNLSMSL